MDWHDYFMDIAHAVSLKSKDTTKVGCVIIGEDKQILTTGWNGNSRGVYDLPERQERPTKYDFVIHAEANAVCNASRSGTALKGATAYVTHCCCNNCADILIQSGIKCVVVGNGKLIGNHKNEIAMIKFSEAGVEVINV